MSTTIQPHRAAQGLNAALDELHTARPIEAASLRAAFGAVIVEAFAEAEPHEHDATWPDVIDACATIVADRLATATIGMTERGAPIPEREDRQHLGVWLAMTYTFLRRLYTSL